nr:hypothetical protein [Corynebacterium cystitidis]
MSRADVFLEDIPHVGKSRATVAVLVLLVWHHTERLAEVLLVEPIDYAIIG